MFKRPVELFKNLFGGDIEKKSISLTDPLALDLFGAFPTAAGPSINAATALRVPAVYSAVVLIAGTIGSLPAKIFVAEADGGKRTTKDHPAYRLVHDEANEWTSAGQLRASLTADALLHDHGYALAIRVGAGKPQEFIRLDPRTVTIKTNELTGEPVYVRRVGTREWIYDFRDVLHVSSPLNLAPIKAGREAIALATILERHASQLFAGGAKPSALFYNDNKKGGEGGTSGSKVIAAIKAAYRAATSSGSFTEPMVLDDGWKYEQIALTSTDAQFAEMRVEQVNEIARVFRVPPHLLFELSRATWSNAEEMFQSFLTLTLRSWLDEWEWAYTRVLLTSEERKTHYVEFVIDDLMTANSATRAETYQKYRAMGAITANEVRAGLNREPLEGGDVLANPNITPGAPSAQNDNGTADKAAA